MIVEMKALGSGEYADTGIKVEPIPGEKFQFKGTLTGQSETPYEGGTFVVHIIIPEEYAFPTFYLSFVIPPPKLPVQAPQGEVYHESMASQHLRRDGRYIFRCGRAITRLASRTLCSVLH